MEDLIVPMKDLVNFCMTRGFVYPNSQIYGGLANTWDYGPLGVELKRNIKSLWWKYFVRMRMDMVGLDGAILMNPKIWEASGHIGNFSDPLVDCKHCHTRFRADHLIEEQLKIDVQGFSQEKLEQVMNSNEIYCPECRSKNFTPIRQFNLMFKTFQGVTEEGSSIIYLRPETAQEIFVQFKNILQTTRKKLPFGVGQIGKSFRNEITPGNFIFRTREFEQMEIEYFIHPETIKENFALWIQLSTQFCQDILGIPSARLRVRAQGEDELAHYAQMTSDIEFLFPFGWGEIAGIAHRGNFDLTVHQEASQENLEYLDPYTQNKFLPDVIEPSFGVDRLFLAVMSAHYKVEALEDNKERIVLALPYELAPYLIAILPLKKTDERIITLANQLIQLLSPHYTLVYDDTGSIGKLYRRQDEIGTPFCLTVDFESLENQTFTIRYRDTMSQERIHQDKLLDFFNKIIGRK